MKLRKNQLFISIIIIMITSIIAIIISFENLKRNNFLVLSTFALNGCLWLSLLMNEVKKRAFSLSFMHWMFCLFFFFFSAIVQYINNKFPWIHYRSDDILLYSNIILFLWTISVLVGENIIFLKFNSIRIYLSQPIKLKKHFFISASILLIIAIWRLYNIGLINLLARSTSDYMISENTSLAMLFQHSVDAIAYFSTLVCLLIAKDNKKLILYIIVFLVLLIAYPPTGLARYKAAAIYLGLMLTTLHSFKYNRMFIALFFFGFIVILPFLNVFRIMSFEKISSVQILNSIMLDMSKIWLAGDYDAYTMVTLAIDYIENHGITYGYQFLGSIFFWIPRQIWNTKPIGSGAEIANSLGLSFTNLSCPLPAEGLINFSIIGLILFGIFIGNIMKNIDDLYWENLNEKNILSVLYPVIVIFFFFVNRGDLLSSTAYLSAFIVVGIIYIKIFSTISNIKIKLF